MHRHPENDRERERERLNEYLRSTCLLPVFVQSSGNEWFLYDSYSVLGLLPSTKHNARKEKSSGEDP